MVLYPTIIRCRLAPQKFWESRLNPLSYAIIKSDKISTDPTVGGRRIMNNDLTGLQKKTNPNTNEVNAVRQLDPGTSGINMDYIANNEIPKTQLEKDAEVAQGQAIRDYVAGLPEIQSPSLTIAPKKPDIDTTVASTTFTTRDQIIKEALPYQAMSMHTKNF